ncbi:hypothetical protein CKM354_000442900 [Cercospora kikuchii]|uniref:Uncharacterized protein n=1 Tax=Cercospora kikuchii TaxID=84275 RepID=A0A9P3CMF1_9PEZI|nr:uncharacterized protein CKM354_000442900 [Cercospora kikuchii]GIZ41113.1 hypothetical protein CKM354_000442900 [Cercospora kikuchii]
MGALCCRLAAVHPIIFRSPHASYKKLDLRISPCAIRPSRITSGRLDKAPLPDNDTQKDFVHSAPYDKTKHPTHFCKGSVSTSVPRNKGIMRGDSTLEENVMYQHKQTYAHILARIIENKNMTANQETAEATSVTAMRSRLQDLPQELYNGIYDLTFTADAKIRVSIPPDSTMPSAGWIARRYPSHLVGVNEPIPDLSRVDRHSRQQFLESYFGNPNSMFVICGFKELQEWAFLMSAEHIALIPKIYYLGFLTEGLREILRERIGIEFANKVESISHLRFREVMDTWVKKHDEKSIAGQLSTSAIPRQTFAGDEYGRETVHVRDAPLRRNGRRAHPNQRSPSARARRALRNIIVRRGGHGGSDPRR